MIARPGRCVAVSAFAALPAFAPADEYVPMAACGELPTTDMTQLSPKGTRTVSRILVGDGNVIAVSDVETQNLSKDTLVPIEQSKNMHKALKKARKNVTFVQLKGKDHLRSQADTRLETLRETAAFIEQ